LYVLITLCVYFVFLKKKEKALEKHAVLVSARILYGSIANEKLISK